jgi:STE24 endopeptidase
MVAGIVRSLASLGALAFAYAPRVERITSTGARWLDPGLFFVATSLAGALVDAPADYVEGYVLERTYELSDQSLEAWLGDRLKALVLTNAIGGALACGVVALMRRFPRSWPLFASIGTVPLMMLANVIGPTFIAPFFNTFLPLEGPLAERIRALAARYGAGDAAILRVDMSRQTKKANAYVVGIFGTKRIVAGDTLLDEFSADEALFVVAHELGHYVYGDAWGLIAAASAATSLTIFVADALRRAGSDTAPDSAASFTRFAFYASIFSSFLGPAIAAFSRSFEWRADRFALAATEDPAAGVGAFTRLRDQNLAEDEQPRWMEVLFSTHPSLKARIAALREAM